MARQLTTVLFLLVAVFIYCEAQGPLCPLNSSDDICGRLCEPSCDIPKPDVCAAVICDESTRGCRCNSGYLRDENTDFCVSPSQCT